MWARYGVCGWFGRAAHAYPHPTYHLTLISPSHRELSSAQGSHQAPSTSQEPNQQAITDASSYSIRECFLASLVNTLHSGTHTRQRRATLRSRIRLRLHRIAIPSDLPQPSPSHLIRQTASQTSVMTSAELGKVEPNCQPHHALCFLPQTHPTISSLTGCLWT
ncbi:hypothetical protein BKA81DRAFT_51749 [Phyllosticta paracitricarpa]|uniref:Uncharacterized protein n=1 Tax=Phyllosticta citricarpa TaxID=55181 RepID=A0ABR1MMZ5_9PEZI